VIGRRQMGGSVTRCLLGAACLVLVALSARVSAAAQEASAYAAEDPRLERRIDVRCNCLSLPDFAETLSEQTGVSVRAAENLADDLLVLSCSNEPLAEVMRRVADHFGFSWARTGEAPSYVYTLTQTQAARAVEERARRDREQRHITNLREMATAMASLLDLPESVRAAKAAEYEAELEAAYGSSGGEEAIAALRASQGRYCADMAQARARIVAAVVANLSQRRWDELAAGRRLVFSSRPIRGEYEMPAAAAIEISQAIDAAATAWENEERRLDISSGELKGFGPCGEAWALAEANPVPDGFGNVQLQYWRGLLRGTVTLRGADRRPLLGASYYMKDSDPPRRPDPERKGPPQSFKLPDELAALVSGTGDDRRIRPGRWFRTEWAGGGARDYTEPLAVGYGALLLALADAAHLPLIADAYDYHHVEPAVPASGTVADWLEALCADAESDWSVKDGWISLRHSRYAICRPLQLPRDTRRAIYGPAAESGGFTLEQLASIAAGISREQRVSYGPFARGLGLLTQQSAGGDLEWLAALGTLRPQSWQALTRGTAIRVRSLPRNTVEALTAALSDSPIVPGVELPELPGLANTTLRIVSYREGDLIEYRDHPDEGATLHRPISVEEALKHAGAAAGSPGYLRVRPGRVAEYRILLDAGGGSLPGATIRLLQMPHGASLSYAELGRDGRQKLEALHER
jgi:hypothetical protein